ncbi:MAG TPA: aldehyde dehydrogenase family protein [Microbacterium sp.]|uniref:aldehyde dehydrogenase family protein n=1 Tax=Microbacterium sp. TaxID=51671 RepID=UPI002B4858FE|nr:aldehyde dehydrogenase family protein [Microbacterium sp.]HKT58166.1 aldehyde dehydrogenase family protein [Microbacterium sp.]
MTDAGLYIGGAWRDTSERFDVRDPATGLRVGTAAVASETDVRDAVAAAASAPRLTAAERARILRQVARDVEANVDEFAALIRAECGKPISAARGEAARAVDTLLLAAEGARHLAGVQVPLDAVAVGEGLTGFTIRDPRGIVGAITPFNFPLNLVCHKIAPALAAGCPVVLKPSERTPLTAARLVRSFEAAGLPAGLLNLVTGDPTLIVGMLASDDRVEVLSFTGSAAVGWELKARSPRKHHVLELGSNTAMVVMGSADIGKAVAAAVTAGFSNSGQACVPLQRVYVDGAVFEEFTDRLAAAAAAVPTGDPDDPATVVGPLITRAAASRIHSWITAAVTRGGAVRAGGGIEGNLLQPTVVADPPADSELVCEEAFGPVISVTPVDGLDDALAHVNASRFGLNTSIFTSDIGEALTYARQAQAGTVLVNVAPSFRADNMPYGGVKDSGQGREGVPSAIEDLTVPRLVVLAS